MIKGFQIIFILLLTFLCKHIFAHELDSNYVKKYKNKLVIGYFQSYRRYEITVGQKVMQDTTGLSNLKYVSPANDVSGFEINYDKISFSFGWKTPVKYDNTWKTGKSYTSAYNLSFTIPQFRIETAFRNYTGFYESNSPNYINGYNDKTPYVQKPSMEMNSGKAKALFFFNTKNRFSFMSAYSCTERQIKSAGSLFFISSFQFLGLRSKTSIIPNQVQHLYGNFYKDFNRAKSYGLGIAPGFSFNIVLFKGLFYNLTFAVGPELQSRYVSTLSGVKYTQLKVGTLADFRTGFGFNGKRFFWIFNLLVDFNNINHKSIKFETRYISGSATAGFRFGLKEGKLIRKMKENNYYKKL